MERTHLSSPRAPGRATFAALVVLAVGLVGSFGVWLVADRLTAERARDRLVVQAETLAEAIERGAINVEVDLDAMAGLFEASEVVTTDEFATMVDRIQAAAGLGGIAYVPLVTADDLSEFIAEARESEPGYSVFEFDAAGERTPVNDRSNYFPVRYFHPIDAASPMGLDVASVPDRLPYLTEAVDSKEAVTTPLTTVAVFDQEGYVVYQPILSPDGEVTGLVVGPVLVEPLIRAAVPPALAANIEWSIVTEQATVDLADDGLVYFTEATIGDETWRLEVRPAAGSSILVEAWRPAAVLGVAAVAVALVAAFATFWYLRAAQSRIGLENAGALMSAKDRFVATVSHELRTPLAAVVGFSELLKGGTLGDMDTAERNEIISTIADQAGDLANIVEDLLVMARADHGTLATVSVPVDVAAQCRQVIERIGTSTSIPITTPPGAPAVRAIGDPGRVRQIIRNLLGNAASYGGNQISISIHSEGSTVRIGVEDNGDGVPAGQAEQIFEPYQRAHAASPTNGSLGLGLSVSRTLARHMGGDLRYHRVEGITVFELQLPAAEPEGSSGGSQSDTTEGSLLEKKHEVAGRVHGASRSTKDRGLAPSRGKSD
jgi:signal transduction histidine kinase